MLGLLALWAVSTTALAADTFDEETGMKRPDILFMIAEDTSWTDWGVYGNRYAKTPHIDNPAEEVPDTL